MGNIYTLSSLFSTFKLQFHLLPNWGQLMLFAALAAVLWFAFGRHLLAGKDSGLHIFKIPKRAHRRTNWLLLHPDQVASETYMQKLRARYEHVLEYSFIPAHRVSYMYGFMLATMSLMLIVPFFDITTVL